MPRKKFFEIEIIYEEKSEKIHNLTQLLKAYANFEKDVAYVVQDNKVIIVGNLGQDPETRYMPSGAAVTNFTVATNESWKDKQTGEQKERTEWHKVAMFNRLAEIAAEYLRKGSQVYIEGKLRTRKWQDRDGNDRWTTEIIADEMQMLGGRGGGGAAPMPSDRGPSGGPPQSPPDDFEDDIPF